MGVNGFEVGTYSSSPKSDGSLGGVGEGVIALDDGATITWTGVGAGRLSPGGAVRYVGAICFTTSAAKYASLNSIAGVFEFEVDAQGNTHSKIWEWK